MIYSYSMERIQVDDPLDAVAGEFYFNESTFLKLT